MTEFFSSFFVKKALKNSSETATLSDVQRVFSSLVEPFFFLYRNKKEERFRIKKDFYFIV